MEKLGQVKGQWEEEEVFNTSHSPPPGEFWDGQRGGIRLVKHENQIYFHMTLRRGLNISTEDSL